MRLSRLLTLALAALGFIGCIGQGAPAQPVTEIPMKPAEVASFAEQAIGSSQLIYVSDYFSFVGQDAQGRVAFALDNNRGRDADRYQAEHIVFLHDEKQGWIDLAGTARYENPQQELRRIPDSSFFTFEGEPASGLTVRAAQAPLELAMSALELKVIRAGTDRVFAMASAPATLKWQDRTLRGRVIYEYLVLNNQNRLSRGFGTRALLSSFSFQGLYLLTQEMHDLYVHRAKWPAVDPTGAGDRLGFYDENGSTVETNELDLTVTDRSQGPGLFRWPNHWQASWSTREHGKGRLQAEVVDFKRVTSLVFGGYAMAIVKGILEQDGKKIPVYGFGELIQWF